MLDKQRIKSLLNRRTLTALIIIYGLSQGASFLESAEASVPPLTWIDIGVVFFFGIIAMCFLLGIQVLTKNQKGIQFAWNAFYFISICTLSSGVSALVWAIWRNSFGPAALLFISVPLGMFGGLFLTKDLVPEKPKPTL